MRRVILGAVLTLALLAAADVAKSSDGDAATAASRSVEQRVLIKHCYAQFRSQTDVARCLARGPA